MNIAITSLTDNPFPGLRPFREDEEHLFFGRENQVDAMVDKLAATHFLAVVGTSGSGKSSLVNCGLRPALRRGLMARAGTAWRMAQFRPGNNPIGAMAQALAKDNVLFSGHKASGLSLAEIIETNLRMSKLGLIDIFEQAALGEGVNLLVVVDQFEELFRYRLPQAVAVGGEHATSEQAVAFVNLLVEIKERAADRIFVVKYVPNHGKILRADLRFGCDGRQRRVRLTKSGAMLETPCGLEVIRVIRRLGEIEIHDALDRIFVAIRFDQHGVGGEIDAVGRQNHVVGNVAGGAQVFVQQRC